MPLSCSVKMGLSEINSKNYRIILDNVKCASLIPVKDSPEFVDSATSYNIKTEIKQQQKHLSDDEILEIITKYKSGKSTYALAEEYRCHRYTISKVLKNNGIEVSNQIAKKKVLAEMIMQMYSEWYRPIEI